jgi:hypothetical protein
LYLLPGKAKELVDLTGASLPDGYAVHWPAVRYLFEPVTAAVEYVLSFDRYVLQLLSWLFWLGLAGGITAVLRRRKPAAIAGSVAALWLCGISFFLIAVAFPFAAPKLAVPPGNTVVDLHSHTWYSHDGGAAPRQSMYYHRRLGFDTFFDTEHNHTNGFSRFPAAAQMKTVYPGMQMSTTEHISLLILADQPFDGNDFRDCTVAELVERAHRRGFVVICPHWWKWHRFSWEELARRGVDGFEIANAGYRKFTAAERNDLVRFCTENNLLMIGTTDWHGWGYSADVWTVLPAPAGDATALFAALRARGPSRVLVLTRPEIRTPLRYLFEPFFGMYYYFTGMSGLQALSWIVWILIAAFVSSRPWFSRILQSLPQAFGVLFFALTIYSLVVWMPLLPENMVLGRLMAPILAFVACCWLLWAKLRAAGRSQSVWS